MILQLSNHHGITSRVNHGFCQFDMGYSKPLRHVSLDELLSQIASGGSDTWGNGPSVVGIEYLWGEPDALDRQRNEP